MIILRVYCDICQIGDGGGTALLGQPQSNEPGFLGNLTNGPVPSAQTIRLEDAVFVVGGDTPTSGNFATAFTQLATDLGTMMTTAGAFSGGTATPLSIVQGWSTGNP